METKSNNTNRKKNIAVVRIQDAILNSHLTLVYTVHYNKIRIF